MKKILISFIFITTSIISNAQTWETIRHDDLVTFQLPAGYTKMDTLGAHIFQSEINDTTYICSFMKDVQPLRFESNESIDAFYNDYFDNLVAKSNKPQIIKKEIIEFGNFRALRATLQRNIIVKELTWEILTIHVKNTTLSFQCLTQKKAKAQFERLEKSIQFNSALTRKDQISEPTISAKTSTTSQYIEYAFYTLVGLIVIIVFGKMVFFKKKTNNITPVNEKGEE
jgi:cell division protein FtsL